MELTKEERINKEIKRLTGLFKNVDRDMIKVVSALISNAAFMSITLDDLQVEINTKGCISEYQNGQNQWGTKKSPEVEIYINMIKNHTAIIRQLANLLPQSDKKTVTASADEKVFFDFIKGNR